MEILKVAGIFIYLSPHVTCSHTGLVRTTVRINRLPPPPTPTLGFQYGCCSGRGGAYWRFSLPCHFILYLQWPSISWGCHFSAEAPALNFSRTENTLQWPCKFYNEHHIVCVWKYCSAIRQQASYTLLAQMVKSACNAGDPGLIPGSGRSPGEGKGNPLQYFCLENSMDRGGWWAIVHGVARSRTRPSNCHSQGSVQTGLFLVFRIFLWLLVKRMKTIEDKLSAFDCAFATIICGHVCVVWECAFPLGMEEAHLAYNELALLAPLHLFLPSEPKHFIYSFPAIDLACVYLLLN